MIEGRAWVTDVLKEWPWKLVTTCLSLFHLSRHHVTTLSSLRSFSMAQNHGPYPPTPEESGCVWPVVSAAYYYSFSLRTAFLMKRSADLMTSHHSHTCTTRLKLFGHVARADPCVDHSRALTTCVAPFPREWNRRSGWPRHTHTWLRTVESDLTPLNNGLEPPIIERRIVKPGACL